MVRVTLLLPKEISLENKVWTTHNRLELVRPAIELAAREDETQYHLSRSFDTTYKTFSEILPGWSIQIEAADTYCSSIAGGLESVRLRCGTGCYYN